MLIAMLCIRFTIITSMEEDYRNWCYESNWDS